jgi:pyruvate/oxaloacetate carboxyltransferase/biotin carboxyl carrier protein
MSKIEFVDQTIRDAQQSLWGLMMRTDHISPIAEMMDRVGYRAIATVGSQAFTIQVRNHDEDPWERIRLLSRLMPKTGLRGSYQTASLSSFDLSTPRSIISLWIKRSVANGIKGFWICDYQENVERFRYFAQIAKAEGAEVVTALMYTSSPVHDDEHWAQKTKLIALAKECTDRIMIEDASGVMTPERTRELISIVQRNCDGIPLEFHCHCNSGQAPLCYLEAIKAGVTTVHTAVAPLANGTSLPSTESILKNVRRLGFETDLDEDALAAVSAHFRKVAEKEGLPVGQPREYDLFHFEHQVPGGMMTNLTRQLREIKMEHRLDEILEEVAHVRGELGYPVMATPYSQIVGSQAFENVISGERYTKITDEVIKYALELYGKPAVPLDPNLMDKIMHLPRTKEFLDWKPLGYFKSVEDLRGEIGPELSDDDLLLKILIPGRQVKRAEPGKKGIVPAPKSPMPVGPPQGVHGFPSEFSVDVDGEVFNVKIAAARMTAQPEGTRGETQSRKEQKPLPKGAVRCGMAGLILSIQVKVGDAVVEGDPLAMIEAMKMRRHVLSPERGIVKEIMATEGEIVDPEDVLVVVG